MLCLCMPNLVLKVVLFKVTGSTILVTENQCLVRCNPHLTKEEIEENLLESLVPKKLSAALRYLSRRETNEHVDNASSLLVLQSLCFSLQTTKT